MLGRWTFVHLSPLAGDQAHIRVGRVRRQLAGRVGMRQLPFRSRRFAIRSTHAFSDRKWCGRPRRAPSARRTRAVDVRGRPTGIRRRRVDVVLEHRQRRDARPVTGDTDEVGRSLLDFMHARQVSAAPRRGVRVEGVAGPYSSPSRGCACCGLSQSPGAEGGTAAPRTPPRRHCRCTWSRRPRLDSVHTRVPPASGRQGTARGSRLVTRSASTLGADGPASGPRE